MPLYVSYLSYLFVSYLYDKQYHTSSAFVLICTSANVIWYNSSVNKKLILCNILNTIFCVLFNFANENITYKATAELLIQWLWIVKHCESMIQ